MFDNEIGRLKELYAKLSDEQIRENLALGQSSYKPDAWNILCFEAKKRSINIEEIQNSADSQKNRGRVEWQDLEEVFIAPSSLEGAFIKSLLEGNGIESFDHQYHGGMRTLQMASAIDPVKIMVCREDASSAREIIEQYLKDREQQARDEK